MAPDSRGGLILSFTSEAASALGGPEWLRSRRAAAAALFIGAELPSTDEEIWRYSRVDDLYLDDFAPLADPASVPAEVPSDLQVLVDGSSSYAGVVILRNGQVVHQELAGDLRDKGVRLGVAGAGDEPLVGQLLARGGAIGADGSGGVGGVSREGAEPDVFVTFNDAFTPNPVVLDVPQSVSVERPLVVAHWTEGDGVATFPRVVLRAGANCDVSVVEVQSSSSEHSLVVPVTEIVVERDARVGYVTLQQLGLTTWQFGRQVSSVDSSATLRSSSVGFGGDYARMRTDCRLVGRGATGNLDAVYFGEGDQTLDFRTFQDHVAPGCTSNLLFKGAVGGRSSSVYTGLIRVGKDAQGTEAFQTNRNIKLSDHAWAWSVPNLMIENNDVRCSHASAVGPIDEEQRFYLESRGVPTDVAERLIVTGFFGEVLAKLPVRELVAPLQSTITAKFERREA